MTILLRKALDGSFQGVLVSDKLELKNPAGYLSAVLDKKDTADLNEAQERNRFLRRLKKINCLYCLDTGNISVTTTMENGVAYVFTYDCYCHDRTIKHFGKEEVKNANIANIATSYFPRCGMIRNGAGPNETYHPEFCKVTNPEGQCLTLIRNGHCPKFSIPPVTPRERADWA